MTTDYSKTPTIYLRSWLLDEFFNAGIVDIEDYSVGDFSPLSPFVPVQDQPETSKLLKNLPYIVYSSMPQSKGYNEDFWAKQEIVHFTIFAVDYNQVLSIDNFLIDILDRKDLSAADVNTFNTAAPIKFQTISLIAESPVKTSEEYKGRYMKTSAFGYHYIRELSDNGRFSS